MGPIVKLQPQRSTAHHEAAYLALAVAVDADLVTLDVSLAAAAGERDVLGTRRGRASEAIPAYGSSDAIAAWTGFGSYLANLRAEALEAGR
jgi:hypothetical protein